jgi:hypothetical protein
LPITPDWPSSPRRRSSRSSSTLRGAEELRDDKLAAYLDAAGHTSRAVIPRVIRNA